jgi:two-component system CheB/CheR fusion protein
MAARPRRIRPPTKATAPPVVGIGASAGGVQALQALFDGLPPDLGLAYVVILHLAPDRHSELAHILSHHTKMPVATVAGPTPLEADHVYVIPPDRSLAITRDRISSEPFADPHGRRAPIDLFFRSLAAGLGDGFALILSGGGSDGALGVKAVKEAGGIVMVQDPAEAEHASMPSAAIATGAVDIVLPLKDLARRLVEVAKAKRRIPDGELIDGDEAYLRRILAQLRVRTGHDFNSYKRSTVLRRVQRRLQVSRTHRLADYYAHLRDDADEAQALFSDLLISVTSFFRDAHAFGVLAAKVIPQLFDGREAGDRLRVWVPGCATGEEAYSIAILLLEETARREVRPEIQVFGSDLDPAALAVAREGRYPAAVEADLGPERLQRYFIRDGDHYEVKRELRDIVLFANHSLLRDPPFSRIDLISCRNLLIYLERELQQQVVATFHYALSPNGYLFLGASETAEHPSALFRQVDRDAHIYQAIAASRHELPTLPRLAGPLSVLGSSAPARGRIDAAVSEAAAHREGLEQVAPPSILVDESNHAVHLSELAGRYLQPSGGRLTADLTELARPELRLELRSALHRAFERGEASLSIPILVKFDGGSHRVYLQVRPLNPSAERGARRAIVFFVEGEAVEETLEAAASVEGNITSETVRRLAEELRLTQSRLRAMREESESANEELRAANEELQSINEEYRSTSEELETSKEELQSVNEELQTVNTELKVKLENVSRANSDLQNLMAATDVATLFLDPALKIKRFTPRLTELFNVTASDEGRPITDFTHQLKYDYLPQDALGVLRDLIPVEREVQSLAGSWFLMRLRPYRSAEDKIDGLVVTFVDITERVRVDEALRRSEEHLNQESRLVELTHTPICVWDLDDGIVQWNRGCEQLYGYAREKAIGRKSWELLQTEIEGGFGAVLETLESTGRWGGELRQTARDGRRLTVEAEMELAKVGAQRLVLESARDITDRKSWERTQRMMVAELSHRVKNTLAVVQSIASQTIRTSSSADEFTERFEGRLQALAKSHRLLFDPWRGADVEALAREQLEPHLAGDGSRLKLEGEPVRLSPDIAVPLGLVLHELATNAAKYGAWSAPDGRVSLSWARSERDGEATVTLNWREEDGPPVTAPNRVGFGSRLISSAIPNSRVRREFSSSGVECQIEAPAPEGRALELEEHREPE